MAYIEKGQNFVEVTFTTNIKEENPIDITKDTSDAVVCSDLYIALYLISHVTCHLLSKKLGLAYLIVFSCSQAVCNKYVFLCRS